jgi:hypothetical protein
MSFASYSLLLLTRIARYIKEIIIHYYLTAIGLTPGGSSTHLHINSTQNTEDETHVTNKLEEKLKCLLLPTSIFVVFNRFHKQPLACHQNVKLSIRKGTQL